MAAPTERNNGARFSQQSCSTVAGGRWGGKLIFPGRSECFFSQALLVNIYLAIQRVTTNHLSLFPFCCISLPLWGALNVDSRKKSQPLHCRSQDVRNKTSGWRMTKLWTSDSWCKTCEKWGLRPLLLGVDLKRNESWTMKKAERRRIAIFKLWCWRRLSRVPWTSKKIKPVNSKGNQPWISIGRTDSEAEALILWLPESKSWLTEKDPDARKDWGHQEKGMTEDEMVRWHHRLNGHEFEQTLRKGGLVCCGSWVTKSRTRLNWT